METDGLCRLGVPVAIRMKNVSSPIGMNLATGSKGQSDGREKDIRMLRRSLGCKGTGSGNESTEVWTVKNTFLLAGSYFMTFFEEIIVSAFQCRGIGKIKGFQTNTNWKSLSSKECH